MRIALCSVPFRPLVGGIETVSAILAEQFSAAGHDVVVITRTAAATPDRESFEIVRRPAPAALVRTLRSADVIVHSNVSLRFAWPQAVVRRPWVIAHHVWTPRTGAAGRLKHLSFRAAMNVAVSRAIAESLSVPAEIVPNPYANDV